MPARSLPVAAFLCAGLLATAPPARAQASPPTACDSLQSPPAQSACLESALGRADAALNQAYRRALDHIEAAAGPDRAAWRAALLAAQHAWIAFRDADCGA